MAKRRIEFHEEASRELEAAFDWYLERSESAAERFLTDLNSATANVAEAPQRGLRANTAWRTDVDVLDTGKTVSENTTQE
jgi:plasmid stabilization system protein ParE